MIAEEYEVLKHTLKTGRYVTDKVAVIDLAARGLLNDHGPQVIAGGMHYFTITTAGCAAVAEFRKGGAS